jgi:hypothetical protein
MWTKYDETLVDWVQPGDIVKHRSKVVTVDEIDDSDNDKVRLIGIDPMDYSIEVTVPCGTYVPLVYWQD